MRTHSKAYHIDCLLYVGFPVAALLAIINLVDYNVVLLLAVGGNVECGEPGFTAVLRADQEVKYCLLFADNTLLLLSTVGNTLGTKY